MSPTEGPDIEKKTSSKLFLTILDPALNREVRLIQSFLYSKDGVYTGWSNLILGQTMGWSENIKVSALLLCQVCCINREDVLAYKQAQLLFTVDR